jgi:hypothetical protein
MVHRIVFTIHLPTCIDVTKRQLALLGAGALATGLLKTSSAFAEGNGRLSGSVYMNSSSSQADFVVL